MGKLILLVLSLFVSAAILELSLEQLDRREWAKKNRQTKPYYTWSSYTLGGVRLGSSRGILKLMIDPLVGYSNLPNQRTPLFSINGRGFRGPEVGEKSSDRKRVVLVGGSAAFGTGLDGDSETFAVQLEKNLANVEVINAAVVGHQSGNELAYIARELVDLEADLIIALGGWNDFVQAGRVKPGKWVDVAGADQVAFHLQVLARLVHSGFFERIAHIPRVLFSNTYRRLGLGHPSVLASDTNRRVEPPGRREFTRRAHGPPGYTVADVEKVSRIYAHNVVKMKRIAATFGSDFLCVLQASKPSMYGGKQKGRNSYKRFRIEVKRVLDSRGIASIDLNEHHTELAVGMFMDDVHLDRRGNRAIARIVAAELRNF